MPLRLVVSPRNLRNNVVEMKGRSETEATLEPLDNVIQSIRDRLKGRPGRFTRFRFTPYWTADRTEVRYSRLAFSSGAMSPWRDDESSNNSLS
jgi:hypothetical protein